MIREVRRHTKDLFWRITRKVCCIVVFRDWRCAERYSISLRKRLFLEILSRIMLYSYAFGRLRSVRIVLFVRDSLGLAVDLVDKVDANGHDFTAWAKATSHSNYNQLYRIFFQEHYCSRTVN